MFHETDKDTKLCTPIDDEEQREQEELDSPETPNIGKVCTLEMPYISFGYTYVKF